MKTRNIIFSLFLLLAIVVTACNPQAAPTEEMTEIEMVSEPMADSNTAMTENKADEIMSPTEEAVADHSGDALMTDSEDDMMDEPKDDPMMAPDWFSAQLTNARTGETFTIAGFKGKVVLVETMAIWSSNCFKQQGQVQSLHNLLGERDDFVSLGVDIDPNENAAALQTYTDKNNFDWLYTVAPSDVSREIGQLYGDQFLNPPSTPMFIIDRQGQVHPLPFGIKSAESLLESLQPFLDAGM